MKIQTNNFIKHPAKYSDILLLLFEGLLQDYSRIRDPFAGTGKLRLISSKGLIFLNELESEWTIQGPADTIGDILNLPYTNNSFDAICTSPTYGIRMADHHTLRDQYKRNSYRHSLRRALHPANSGQLQWSEGYRAFHIAAWKVSTRVSRSED